MSNLKAFSLTEVLMALFTGTLLLSMVIGSVIQIKSHYHKTKSSLAESLDLYYLSELIQDRIRKAGFTPCLGINQLITADTRTSIPYPPLQNLTFDERSIQINRMDEQFLTLPTLISRDKLQFTKKTQLNASQVLIISDCYHAEVHQILKMNHHKHDIEAQLKKPLVFQYDEPVFVAPWREEVFYYDRNKKRLMYRMDKAEELSFHIVKMEVGVVEKHFRRLVNIVWQFSESNAIELKTALRMSG